METEIAQFQCACFSNKCSNNIVGPGLFQLLIVDVSIAILRWLHYNNAPIWLVCMCVWGGLIAVQRSRIEGFCATPRQLQRCWVLMLVGQFIHLWGGKYLNSKSGWKHFGRSLLMTNGSEYAMILASKFLLWWPKPCGFRGWQNGGTLLSKRWHTFVTKMPMTWHKGCVIISMSKIIAACLGSDVNILAQTRKWIGRFLLMTCKCGHGTILSSKIVDSRFKAQNVLANTRK